MGLCFFILIAAALLAGVAGLFGGAAILGLGVPTYALAALFSSFTRSVFRDFKMPGG